MAELPGAPQVPPDRQLSGNTTPIDYLAPNTKQHEYALAYLQDRLRYSERKMKSFYGRWQLNELQLQAYMPLSDYDAMLKSVRETRVGPAAATSITVPFTWSTINTITTYLLHLFAGRKPIFNVSSYRAEQVRRAQHMETLLQYNADVERLVRALHVWLQDGETYGLAVLRTMWSQRKSNRIVTADPHPDVAAMAQSFGMVAPSQQISQEYVSFEGNNIANIDPFMFFPDPRVPMNQVNEKGEFVFWRAFENRHMLLRAQAAGQLKWVDTVPTGSRRFPDEVGGDSVRSARSLGESNPGWEREGITNGSVSANYQVDQCSIEIIPSELGLGTKGMPEKWLFTILNGQQIVQAQPLRLNHNKHPVIVAEPNSVGYAFGQLSTVDMLGPMQELMSWFMNSHIHNVRTALNNMLVVDPTRIEMQDLKTPGPGKIIRLKNTAFGQSDPNMAVRQLAVADVTRGHVTDFQTMAKMASDLTGASENLRGLQDFSGRKTATEVRTASDSGASRMAAKGMIYSAQGMTDLAMQMSYNYQQSLTESFELQVLGLDAQTDSVRITPDSIQGDFFFPVSDGTLPIDKAGMLDIWRQIFQGVLTDPTGILRQNFSIVEMFKFLCQLGGAQNINSFQIHQVPDQQAQAAVAAGNGVPMQQAMSDALSGAGLQVLPARVRPDPGVLAPTVAPYQGSFHA